MGLFSTFGRTVDGQSRVTVPWEEFKKILRMDENEIVLPLDTFHKLVAQTGAKTPPRIPRGRGSW